MNPRLRREDPPYIQVATHLKERITSGELRPGDHVPSEREIVDEWGVSRATATKVLATLRADGLVESRPGSGTVVRSARGLADFTLATQAGDVVIRHEICGTSQVVTTLVEATEWAKTHQCPR